MAIPSPWQWADRTGRGRYQRAGSGVLVTGMLVWCLSLPPGQPRTDASVHGPPRAAPAVSRDPVFTALSDAEAWACLPARVRGEEAPLPLWARTLARTLPYTTAAMLELDALHRARGPLDPTLRGQIRWATARADRCGYGEAYALADLRRAGATEDAIRDLTGGGAGLSADARAAVAFAQKLATAASTVTDEEVAALVARFGVKRVVAIVFCVAHATFQDRLLLALGTLVEPGGPLPPLDARFARRSFGAGRVAPSRMAPGDVTPAADADPPAAPDWSPLGPASLRARVEGQRARRPRIPLPEAAPGANRWGMVGQIYQPELATAWSACAQAFSEEADQDPVFEQSLFWVVTRANDCFY